MSQPLPLRTRPDRGPSDAILLRAFAAGKEHAFDVLVARHGARVRTYLGHLLRDRAAAEDLTQEVFLALMDRAGSLDPDGELLVWLLRVARNEAFDHLRRRRLHLRLLDSVAKGVGRLAARVRAQPARPDQELARAELLAALDGAVAELPEPHRSVFVLREREGLSYEQIGVVLDCSPKTVSTRLHRARRRLRERLAEHLGEGRA